MAKVEVILRSLSQNKTYKASENESSEWQARRGIIKDDLRCSKARHSKRELSVMPKGQGQRQNIEYSKIYSGKHEKD